jgi:TRAP transporter TAXI family solute receptor
MEREQAQGIAIIAGIAALLAALATGRLPRWLRVTLVVCLAALSCGAGLFAYRYLTHPATLTLAAGSIDGDVPRLMSAISAQMAATGAPVRLKIIDKGTALEAINSFAAGETDLAIARADIGDLSAARTVVVMTYAAVLIVVPPGSAIDSIDGLKGKTVGVIAAELNRGVIAAITKAYDLDRAKVSFKNIEPKDAAQALQSKQIQALLVVMPISEKYLGMLRDLFPRNAKLSLGLVPIESAGAIAADAGPYESYDLPKGTIRGSPPVPDDDLTTFRVPLYLVANKKLGNDVVSGLAKAVMDARRDLLGEYPLLAQIGAPSTDKNAHVLIHPGAAAYFDGEEQGLLDKYGDKAFYVSMLLGTLVSILAAAWKFMTRDTERPEQRPLMRLYALMDQIGGASSEAELKTTERRIDDILKAELEKYSNGGTDAAETAALGLATHRLERLIGQRRAELERWSGSAPST